MTSSDWSSDNVCLKCTDFRVYIFFAHFGWFRNIKSTQNVLLNGIRENKYAKYAQNSYFTKYTKKICTKLIQLNF